MKITTEQLKQIVKEELEATLQEQQPLDEGVMDLIKKVFNRNDPFEGDYGNFKEDATYPPKSYGEFVQSSGVISTMAKEKINVEKNAVKAAVETVIGTGEGRIGAIATMGLALAGVLGSAAVGAMLGFVGVGAGIVTMYKAFKKNPSMIEKYPSLSLFSLDPKWEEILDDDLETEILDEYKNYFIAKVKSTPEKRMISLDKFTKVYLRMTKDGRTLRKPRASTTQE